MTIGITIKGLLPAADGPGPLRWVVAVVVLTALLVTGCTEVDGQFSEDGALTSQARSSGTMTVTVDDAGFEVTVGPVTAVGAPGVAPTGTQVTLREADAPAEVEESGLKLAAPPFEIFFEDGTQPDRPVEVRLELSSAPARDDTLAFSTLNSETELWEGLEVEIEGTTASVSLEHFSFGVFTWVQDVIVGSLATLMEFVGMRFPAPDCHRRSMEVGDRRYRASVDSDDVYACAELHGEQVVLSLYGNSPFVWKVAPDEHATGLQPESAADLSSRITRDAYSIKVGNDFSRETLLVAGGSTRLLLGKGAEGTTAQLTMSPGLGMIALVFAMLDPFIDKLPDGDLLQVSVCLGDFIAETEPEFVSTVRTAVGCVGPLVGRAAGFMLSIVVSVAPALATGAAVVIKKITGGDTIEAILVSESVVDEGISGGYEVPEYCDQPSRTVQVGHTEVDYKATNLDEPVPWPGRTISVTQMVCTAGGVTWPGVLLAHDERGRIVGDPIFLSDLEPAAYRGHFRPADMQFDGVRATVPYSWQSSGGVPHVSGRVVVEWDQGRQRLIVVSNGTDAIDWLNTEYLTPWSPADQPETFVDGCSRGPNFPNCVLKLAGTAAGLEDSSQAAVLFFGYDSTGWPTSSYLGMYAGGDGVAREVSFPGSGPMIEPLVGCDVSMSWVEERTLIVEAYDCAEAGLVGTFNWTLAAFEPLSG